MHALPLALPWHVVCLSGALSQIASYTHQLKLSNCCAKPFKGKREAHICYSCVQGLVMPWQLSCKHVMHGARVYNKLAALSSRQASLAWMQGSLPISIATLCPNMVTTAFPVTPGSTTGVTATGWQLTEVDEPYRQVAATARSAAAAAAALKKPDVAEGLTGGDPGALSHHAAASEPQAASQSEPQQSILPQDMPRSDASAATNSSSRSAAVPDGALISAWRSVIGLIGSLVSKLMYALNSVLSSMEIPGWALRAVSALAMGPLQKKLLQLYAEGGDHSRRLSSVVANGKFSSIQAGPNELWEVSAVGSCRVLHQSGVLCLCFNMPVLQYGVPSCCHGVV